MRPILEYVSGVVSPHCNKHIQQLKAVQGKATRFVTQDVSVTNVLLKLEWPTFQEHRNESKLDKIMHAFIVFNSSYH